MEEDGVEEAGGAGGGEGLSARRDTMKEESRRLLRRLLPVLAFSEHSEVDAVRGLFKESRWEQLAEAFKGVNYRCAQWQRGGKRWRGVG